MVKCGRPMMRGMSEVRVPITKLQLRLKDIREKKNARRDSVK